MTRNEQEKSVCAIDSGMFQRGGLRAQPFKAPFGIAVTITNYQTFKELYNQTMNELFQKYGKSRDKYVYSSSEIMKFFNNPSESDNLFENFVEKIAPSINALDVFYSWFSKGQPSEILIYGGGPTAAEKIPPIKFLESILNNSYPHLCAWKYYDSYSGNRGIPMFLDNFQAEVTKAWFAIQNFPNLFVLVKGDECNPAVSTSDILLKVLNNRLYRRGGKLYPEQIAEAMLEFSDRVNSHFLGQKFLSYIVPVYQRKINFEERLKHPIIFLIREPGTTAVTREAAEASPLWKCIQNFAYRIDGCAKFFSPDTDFRIMMTGDFLTYTGPEGKTTAEIYVRMGYKAKIISPEQLISENALK